MAGMAIAMLLLLCGAIYSLSNLTSAPWTRPLKTPKIAVEAARPVPAFDLTDDAGKHWSPASLEGKWTLVTFWSFGCAPCMVELPGMNQFVLNWQGPEFEVLTINTDEEKTENLEQAKLFLQEQQIVLPTIFDTHGQIRQAFDVTEYPRHFMVNPRGEIIWAASGAFAWNDPKTKDQILKLMERDSPTTRPDPAE
jgi:cytochrome oxidase Cu insertion factor (SCO1/SenC/PrrC family)